MNERLRHTVAVVTVALLAAQPTYAVVNEFTGDGDGVSWNDGGNWDFGVPTSSHEAWIPGGKSCELLNGGNPGVADSIDVDGTLMVDSEQTLTIDTDSWVNGTLYLGDWETGAGGAQLLVTTSLTITGYGGTIRMWPGSEIDEASGGPYVVTFDDNCPDELLGGCGLTVAGAGEINTGVVNNSFVIGDFHCPTSPEYDPPDPCALSLNQAPVSGVGEWRAHDKGWLQTNVEVTGAGTWRIPKSAGAEALIEVNECCDSLSGDVIIKSGTLKLDEHFCTSGDLSLVSEYDSIWNAPQIRVAPDKIAGFGGATCLSCG